MSLDLHGIEARNRRASEYLYRKEMLKTIEDASHTIKVLHRLALIALVLTALAGLALAIGGAS